jgi:hypothetical protein
MSESVVLCEGYLDRAFWAGWLLSLGCTVPGKPGEIYDSAGRPVSKGQYLFHSQSRRHIRVVPCGGKPEVRKAARLRIERRMMEPRLRRLVVNVDVDTLADPQQAATGLRLDDVLSLVQEFDPEAKATQEGDVVLDGWQTLISLVRWEAADQVADGVPNQQTLERLVCAALVAVYPDRRPAVQRWLDSRPEAPMPGPKEYGWSYMAGWYAEHGCEDFYRNLWRDDPVVAELRSRLTQCGAWRVAEALAE